jgi:hypothetical protein
MPFLDAHHRFIAEECDWGFTRFSELRKLFSVQEGHTHPTVEDDCADVSVFVRVLEDPTGVLWHNFVKYVVFPSKYPGCYPDKLVSAMTPRRKPVTSGSRTRAPRAI